MRLFLPCFLTFAMGSACAAAPWPEGGKWTLYAGQMIANDLPPLAFDVVRNRLQWRPSYFLGGSYMQPVSTPQWLGNFFARLGLEGVTNDVEYVGLQHFHRQNDKEIAIAYMTHSAYAQAGGLRWRAGGGIGPSLALSRPSAEDGAEDDPEKKSRFQHYIALEVEASSLEHPNVAMVLRLHHRSGAYGLIAPDGVGSNFITLGLRVGF